MDVSSPFDMFKIRPSTKHMKLKPLQVVKLAFRV